MSDDEIIKQAVKEATVKAEGDFSWLSTGMVCQKFSALYAALGFWGRPTRK